MSYADAVSQPGFQIRSLDGVRALAVIIVFIGHGRTAPSLWPGHVGVTIFFFLSGYLIVTLLRRETEKTGTLSIGKFYLRRILRILPPAYVAISLAVILAAIGAIEPAGDLWGVLAEVFNYTNYYIVIHGREGLPPETSQLWSLAVEEHYYLVIPAALLMMLRRLTRQQIGWTLLGIAGLVVLWRIVLGVSGGSFDRLYVSTDSRIDSLLVGSAMALLWNPALQDQLPRRLVASMGWLAGVAAVAFVASSLVEVQAFRLGVADTIQYVCLIPIFWYIVSSGNTAVAKILNLRWVRRLGVLSFSIYLLHRIALGLVEHLDAAPIATDLAALALSIGAAATVYELVEKPCRRLRQRLELR